MPNMDGFELIVHLQASANLSVIIVFSASVFEENHQRSLKAGAKAFLPKPSRSRSYSIGWIAVGSGGMPNLRLGNLTDWGFACYFLPFS
ncbi:response regulator [Nostoc favosum]|uniref:Response regulator n=1 Tax=Nostoc favosum CHAB5714 TaxID=2780399 RepID=A0ABS8IBU9_9NOSO|nr:response regulator [Nostoc favosum]MCC5601351.1 response regulator [Nostoc favosum CHAB5714]